MRKFCSIIYLVISLYKIKKIIILILYFSFLLISLFSQYNSKYCCFCCFLLHSVLTQTKNVRVYILWLPQPKLLEHYFVFRFLIRSFSTIRQNRDINNYSWGFSSLFRPWVEQIFYFKTIKEHYLMRISRICFL